MLEEGQRNEREMQGKEMSELDENGLEQGLEAKNSDPFAIFPEVVMRDYLLKNLESPEDKWNLCLFSPSADKLLKTSIWNWHFKELFQIPNIHNLFSKHELLNFRLVSKNWRNSVDGFWETMNGTQSDYKTSQSILSSSSTLACYGKCNPTPKWLCLLPNLAASTNLKIAKFLEETKGFQGNPFPSRAASFLSFTDGNEDDSGYWNNVQTILDRFGAELRSMEIRSCSDITTLSIFILLQEYLEKVPHLATLDLTLYSTRIGQLESDPIIQFLLPKFPPLPNLTRLSISHGKLPIHQPLAIYFDQLVSLNVRASETFMGWYSPRAHSKFPKLKHFAVSITKDRELEKLELMTSPLIEIDIKSRLTNVAPSVYFHFLGNFSKSLCACKIQQSFKCDAEIKNYEALRLQEPAQTGLPELKVLSLNISKCKESLMDQLLNLGDSLEHLEVVVEPCLCQLKDPSGEKGENGELQIFKIRGNMYDSSVWGLMPYLQEIHVRKGPILKKYKRSLLAQGTSTDK